MPGSPITPAFGVLSVSAFAPRIGRQPAGNRLLSTVVRTVSDGAKSVNTGSPLSLPIARYCMSMNR